MHRVWKSIRISESIEAAHCIFVWAAIATRPMESVDSSFGSHTAPHRENWTTFELRKSIEFRSYTLCSSRAIHQTFTDPAIKLIAIFSDIFTAIDSRWYANNRFEWPINCISRCSTWDNCQQYGHVETRPRLYLLRKIILAKIRTENSYSNAHRLQATEV